MDFGLTTEQDILKRSAREFLATECTPEFARQMAVDERGCPPELWQKIAELGWTALPFPERYDGVGGNIVDLAVLLEEMGRAHLPGPYFAAMVGGLTILEAGDERQMAELLPRVASGEMIVTLALLEQSLSYESSAVSTEAVATASEHAITGTKLFVPDVHLADCLVCVARTSQASEASEGISLFLVESNGGTAPGIIATRLKTMAGDKQYEVVFGATPVSADNVLGAAGEGWRALSKVLQVGAVGQCAELVGAAQRALELAVEQGNNRVQFGQRVGSFQAIQHHCANMLTDIDLGRFLTYQAAWMLSEGLPCTKQVSAAKAYVGDAYIRVCELAHQILGGNGLIDEHEMPLISKRAIAGQHMFGNADYHRELVVRELGLTDSPALAIR